MGQGVCCVNKHATSTPPLRSCKKSKVTNVWEYNDRTSVRVKLPTPDSKFLKKTRDRLRRSRQPERRRPRAYSRKGTFGRKALCSEHGLRASIETGCYRLADICVYPDVSISPPCREICGVVWQSGEPSGTLLFPADFDCRVPVVDANPAYLAFYGCCFADGSDFVLQIKFDFDFQDFTYRDYKENWVLNPDVGPGCLGIEHHEFIHLECPMDHVNTGYFLLAKMLEHEYEDEVVMSMTAFRFPAFSTVYIGPRVLHSNDHCSGKWRTMLPSFSEADKQKGYCDIDHVLLKQASLHGGSVNANLTFGESVHQLGPIPGQVESCGGDNLQISTERSTAMRRSWP